jgi:alpha-L-rhamnosidase
VALVEDLGNGHYFIDLGQEVIGGLQLTLEADEPHTIRLCFGEELNADGSVRYRMRTSNVYEEFWTLREGEQTLENYSMKTFRYVDVFDCHATITEDKVRAVALRKSFDAEESSFQCSNAVLCHLYDTFKYAICATNQDLYVDSQSRERCAYEGDALINMLSSYTYESDVALPRFSTDYLLTHRTWPAEYALMPIHMVRLDYLYSGNRSLLERVYPQLRNLILAEQIDPDIGLYPSKAAPHNGWDSILVDWPVTSRDGYEMRAAYYNTVYNAMMHISLRDMAVMAGVLGKDDDATAFRAAADALRHDMIEKLYDPAECAFRDGLAVTGKPVDHFAQHATAFALCAAVYSDAAMRDSLGRHLVGQETIRTSIYGAFFLLDALYHAGFGAYATALLADDDLTPGVHSFASSLYNGGVTIAPEAWNVGEKGNMTFSHPWGSAPASMIVRGMFGIRPTRPGFHKFDVRPQIGDLPYASIRVPTVKGTIVVSIGQNREAYEAEVTVPPNTKATVYLPAVPGGTDTLFVNNQKANFPLEDGHFVIGLGAGTHRLQAQ